jgi:hypothetical protein
MAAPYPAPSPLVVAALDQLRIAAESPPDSDIELRQVAMLPRPWDPASCPPELRDLIYVWLDAVAGWINEDLTWRDRPRASDLLARPPHIIHELAIVACLRWEADHAVTAAVLEDWHRFSLPMFLDRLALRIGPTAPIGVPHGFGNASADQPAQLADHRDRFTGPASQAASPSACSRLRPSRILP